MTSLNHVAVLGGTGKLGFGLAKRLAFAGVHVSIGSRDESRAIEAAANIKISLPSAKIDGSTNRISAEKANLVILSVPLAAHAGLLDDIQDVVQGKIVVDTTVPLVPPDVTSVHLPKSGSIAISSQMALGDGVQVVAAFHHIAAHKLLDVNLVLDCDVLICGNSATARADVVKLVDLAGLDGIEAGPLANAVALESLTPLLIWMNKNRQANGAGIKITGRRNAAL